MLRAHTHSVDKGTRAGKFFSSSVVGWRPVSACRRQPNLILLDVKTMKKIRTAILGYGRSGSTMHAGPIEKIDDAELDQLTQANQ